MKSEVAVIALLAMILVNFNINVCYADACGDAVAAANAAYAKANSAYDSFMNALDAFEYATYALYLAIASGNPFAIAAAGLACIKCEHDCYKALKSWKTAQDAYNAAARAALDACKCKKTGATSGSGATLTTQSIEEYTRPIIVAPNTSATLFVLNSENGSLSLKLLSPNGTSITPLSDDDSSIYHYDIDGTIGYLVIKPDPGIWTMEVEPFWSEKDKEKYTLFAYKFENESAAAFNDYYADKGVDDDGNGLYDHIDVTVGTDIKTAGWYMISGSLFEENTNKTIFAFNKTYLEQGNRSQTLEFYGMNSSSSYYLKNLSLKAAQPPSYASISENGMGYTDLEGDVGFQDFRAEAYKTKTYDKLDWPINTPWSTGLIGAYSDHGIDANGDGRYEILAVDVGVNIAERGKYTMTGDLYDLNKSEVAWSIDSINLEPGRRTMHLNFDGMTIQKHRANGPYILSNLSLWEGNWSIKDAKSYAYSTTAYNYSDFGD